jgi:multiple sugar transport system permease protein
MRSFFRKSNFLTYILLILGLVLVWFPLWYMLATSFKLQSAIFELPPRLWPEPFTIQNYINILTTNRFDRYFFNSVKVSVTTVGLTVLVSSMLAYAFARLDFPRKEWLFSALLLGMMVPPIMLMIPQFIVVTNLNLQNQWGLILVYATMNISMQTFLLRGIFEAVPRDLEEAALIDGAGSWMIFWKIILPLSKPGLAVVIINSFLYSWEEFAWAQILIKEEAMRTLPIAIANYQGEHLTEWGHVFAATMIALIPVFIVYLIFQRHFVQGISTTGIKG